MACKAFRWKFAALLLDNGADLHHGKNASEAMHYAVYDCCDHMVALLLSRGVEPSRGYLHDAIRNFKFPILKHMVAYGADLASPRGHSGTTPANLAARNNTRHPTLSLLAANGAELERKDNEGMNALLWAVQNRMAASVLLLTKYNVDVIRRFPTDRGDASDDSQVVWHPLIHPPTSPFDHIATLPAHFTLRARPSKDLFAGANTPACSPRSHPRSLLNHTDTLLTCLFSALRSLRRCWGQPNSCARYRSTIVSS